MPNSDTFLDFGDLFSYRDREYVYLCQIDEITHAALILDQEETERFNLLADKRIQQNKPLDGKVYCYVILTTTGWTKRAAHLHKTDEYKPITLFQPLNRTLNDKDLENILNKILKNKKFMPKQLVKYCESLQNNKS